MNSRQRVLLTLAFEETDRPPFDLMEGCVWPELLEYFRVTKGLQDASSVIEYLDPDFRWTFLQYNGPVTETPDDAATPSKVSSKEVVLGPLSEAETISDIEAYPWPDPAVLGPADYAAARTRWPDKAIVFCQGWMPLFWTSCELFGVEAAMLNMTTRPDLYEALILRQHAITMDILTRSTPAAQGHCDLAWLGDDFAHQRNMMISPALWRRFIKPYLSEQVRLLRQHGMLVLFHSCGAVRPILPDLIEIGVNALLVFQTSAQGMDAPSIASDFGGKLGFYGGIDVQHLLSFGSPQEVEDVVNANCQAFANCGGYIVANSHHTLPTIRAENIYAMCQAVKKLSRSNLFNII
jgi:uroporphyrinogen decarboxylase